MIPRPRARTFHPADGIHDYLSPGDEAVLSRLDNLANDSSGTTKYAQYIWDARYTDAPVVRFHDANTDGTIDDTVYYATDANMNVAALVGVNPRPPRHRRTARVVERWHGGLG